MAGPDSDLLSPHLQERVAQGASKLLLNLTAVRQLDSWSINAIAKTYASLSRQGGSLKILCPSSRIRAVLKVVRLLDLIPTFEDEAEALANFRPRGPLDARRIASMRAQGLGWKKIAWEMGCGVSTVPRVGQAEEKQGSVMPVESGPGSALLSVRV
jgi:anti-sigma B factor antagonist